MRIAKTFEVSFTYPLSELGTPAQEEFWIQPDAGDRFKVLVANHPKILAHFEWLDENDCLRHLYHPGPSYETNTAEVEAAQHRNAMIEENAYALGRAYKSQCVITGTQTYHVPGLIEVPERIFTCTWTFWSKEHAVMFKLARGGEI